MNKKNLIYEFDRNLMDLIRFVRFYSNAEFKTIDEENSIDLVTENFRTNKKKKEDEKPFDKKDTELINMESPEETNKIKKKELDPEAELNKNEEVKAK